MKPFSLNIKGRVVEFDHPVVMGILNVTPDSFYRQSRCADETTLCRRAEAMIDAGARMLDVGGCSTRPGADAVDEPEERRRVAGAVSALRKAFPEAIISVDTSRALVAEAAADAGADMINDVSGCADSAMADTVARLRLPYVLTQPGLEPSLPIDRTAAEAVLSLQTKLRMLTLLGVADVIVDPGFGFGKTLEQNYELMRSLPLFDALGCPILVGVSRKSMITRLIGCSAEAALNATTALNTISLAKGASILRVHDVAEAVETIRITQSAL